MSNEATSGTTRTPVSYSPCTLRCVLPVDTDGSVGVAIDTGSGIVRLKLTAADFAWLQNPPAARDD